MSELIFASSSIRSVVEAAVHEFQFQFVFRVPTVSEVHSTIGSAANLSAKLVSCLVHHFFFPPCLWERRCRCAGPSKQVCVSPFLGAYFTATTPAAKASSNDS
jgi:hypothetical protein